MTYEKRTFKIPIGLPKRKWYQFWKKKKDIKESKETIKKLIDDYKEDIAWGEFNGEVNINGEKYIPYKREIWIPSPIDDDRSPNIDIIGDDNPYLENNEDDVDTEQDS